MEIQYKVCGEEDLETLLALRLALLREANGYAPDTYMGDVEENNRLFLQENMNSENHIAYLACREGQVVGCGGLCFYTLMPTCQGPNGRCAHVMNIYTLPQYRRQGVGRGMLRHLRWPRPKPKAAPAYCWAPATKAVSCTNSVALCPPGTRWNMDGTRRRRHAEHAAHRRTGCDRSAERRAL